MIVRRRGHMRTSDQWVIQSLVAVLDVLVAVAVTVAVAVVVLLLWL